MEIDDYKVQSIASNYGFELDNASTEAKNLGIKESGAKIEFIEKKAKKYLKSLSLTGELMVLDFAYREDPLIFGSEKWGNLVQSEIDKKLHSKEVKEKSQALGYSSVKDFYNAKFEELCGEQSLER